MRLGPVHQEGGTCCLVACRVPILSLSLLSHLKVPSPDPFLYSPKVPFLHPFLLLIPLTVLPRFLHLHPFLWGFQVSSHLIRWKDLPFPFIVIKPESHGQGSNIIFRHEVEFVESSGGLESAQRSGSHGFISRVFMSHKL